MRNFSNFSIILFLLVLAVVLQITLGALVRITDSGLSCPDWPLCYGGVIPPMEFASLIEYSHRTLAVFTGIVIVAIGSIAVIKYRNRSDILTLSILAVVLVIIQGILGGITVVTELTPKIVTLHMGVALLLFGVIVAGLVIANSRDYSTSTSIGSGGGSLLVVLTVAGLYALAVSGAYVRQSGSLGTCMTWPLCDEILSGSLLVLTHIVHRIGSLLIGIMIIVLCTRIWRNNPIRLNAILGGLILLFYVAQVIVGALMIWTGLSEWTRALHLSLGAAMFGSAVILLTLVIRNSNSSSLNQPTKEITT